MSMSSPDRVVLCAGERLVLITRARRFCQQCLAGLVDRPRPGRPRRFPTVAVAQVKAMACELPAERGLPLSRWSPDLAREAVEAQHRHLDLGLHGPPLARPGRPQALAAPVVDPPRDPQFADEAARVLDLYARSWQGEALGDDEYVISADDTSQLQALRRRHPDLPPAPGRVRRQEFEYRRGGTLAYLAAYDVHDARVLRPAGLVQQRTRSHALTASA